MDKEFVIIGENAQVAVLQLDHVAYSIRKDGNVLIGMKRVDSYAPLDVTIPKEFPSGHRIDSLGGNFVKGCFSKIVIPNGIQVSGFAFDYALANEVVWPNDIHKIPDSCFWMSHVEKVSNIDHVTQIGKRAFQCSSIKHIKWPENCDTVPLFCFWECRNLDEIDVSNVKCIERGAFASTAIRTFDWPENCVKIPEECFCNSALTKLNGLSNVKHIGRVAFCDSDLSDLDLSCTEDSCFEEGSLYGLPNNCTINWPYYSTEDDFKYALKEVEIIKGGVYSD